MLIPFKRWFNPIPRSLLARTILVFIIALVSSQIVSVLLFRHYSREPRIQLVAIGFMTQLKTIRAVLESVPVTQHAEFLKKLREEGGVRVTPPRGEDTLEPAPNIPALSVLRDRLRDEFGPQADIYQRPRPNPALPPVLIVKIFVAEKNSGSCFRAIELLSPIFRAHGSAGAYSARCSRWRVRCSW